MYFSWINDDDTIPTIIWILQTPLSNQKKLDSIIKELAKDKRNFHKMIDAIEDTSYQELVAFEKTVTQGEAFLYVFEKDEMKKSEYSQKIANLFRESIKNNKFYKQVFWDK